MPTKPTTGRRFYIVRWMIAGALFGAFFPIIAWRLAVADSGALSFGELHTLYPMMWIIDLAPTVMGLAGGAIGVLYKRLADSKAQTEATAKQIAASWTAELHSANLALAETIESRGIFYAAVTHELRSPLTAIVGYADVAEELVSEPPELTGYLSEIYAAATAMVHMVNDLLDATKLEATGIAIEMSQVSCRAAIDDVVGRLSPLAKQKGLLISAPHIADPMCWADPDRLRQCLTNVVANAIKYSDRGTVEIRALEIDGVPAIEVEDQGVGISATDLETIFGVFDSGSNATGRRDSSGLGLAISRTLIKAMDGDLTAESAGPGHGSTFRLTLSTVNGREPESRTASLVTTGG